jgi:hypothetical protein
MVQTEMKVKEFHATVRAQEKEKAMVIQYLAEQTARREEAEDALHKLRGHGGEGEGGGEGGV